MKRALDLFEEVWTLRSFHLTSNHLTHWMYVLITDGGVTV